MVTWISDEEACLIIWSVKPSWTFPFCLQCKEQTGNFKEWSKKLPVSFLLAFTPSKNHHNNLDRGVDKWSYYHIFTGEAIWHLAKQTWALEFTEAPESNNTSTANFCPASAAMCSAVFPFLVVKLTPAPRFRSSFTTSIWPSLDDKCNALSPFY